MTSSGTVVGVRRHGRTAIAADGQATLANQVLKHRARRVRRLWEGRIVCGYDGPSVDAHSLLERFEARRESAQGDFRRAAVEFAWEWRTDAQLAAFPMSLLMADCESLLVIDGKGNAIEPDDGVIAIGIGGGYALAAGRALLENTSLEAEAIAREAIRIASELCVYTNDQISIEVV